MLPNPPTSSRKLSRWHGPSGYREVFSIAIPLVLSTGSVSIMLFVDRMFLSWYSLSALQAALPAGLMSFTIISFFLGTGAYVNTFVAQYLGSGRPERIGPSIWQAIYFALAAGLLVFLLGPLVGKPIFQWADHGADVTLLEMTYFNILIRGAGFAIFSGVLSSFFSGRGKTWPIMWIHLGTTSLNILLDYIWIFGNWGFEERGIAGAARATVTANACGAIAFLLLFLRRGNRFRFASLSGWRFDGELFRRLMRFGLPSGVQFSLDMLAFSIFVLLVGKLGNAEEAATNLAATNLTFQVNLLVFLPMLGFGLATSTLVGRRLGENRPDLAARATWSAFQLTVGYMSFFALLYLCIPLKFIQPFEPDNSTAEFDRIRELAVVLLRFVAAYSIFDTLLVIFSAALRGAGDTRFVMIYSVLTGWGVLVLPTWVLYKWGEGNGIYKAWVIISVYVALLGFGFLTRFMRGKWRSMRVIETEPHPSPTIEIIPPSGTGSETW